MKDIEESMIITFLPINNKIEAKEGSNLYWIASENGIDLNGICSGRKSCGKCKVLITKGNSKEFLPEEMSQLTEKERNDGVRLACCFTIKQDTCVIILNHQDKKTIPDVSYIKQKIQKTSNHYGAAFDIGTTSVVAELWDLDAKTKIAQQSRQNPQSIYGADVISRIAYANQDEKSLNLLSQSIRKCCNNIIYDLSKEGAINNIDISSMVIAGNTVMTRLFLNKSVERLARVPFYGISYEGEEKSASEIGIDIGSNGTVYIMPGIGGYVGSDTLGCILYENLAYSKGNHLMVDIGTNGEIVLAKDGKMTACSTAAGPAFEGASLHQGMRAVDGAISRVKIDKETIQVDYIGSHKKEVVPIGICGSGVIEAVSELYENNRMDESGRLLGEAGDRNFLTLWSGTNSSVILTQKDIRELQLAKGAIYAGITMLLRELQITAENLDTIYLAGAFGSSLDLKKAITIGLLPDINTGQIQYIGNGALGGAVKILLSEVSKQEVDSISKTVNHLELALCNGFEEQYLEAVSFPIRKRHTE